MSWKDQLIVGKQELPPRLCFYGVHGIGKSTLASQFPNPIFISTEDGVDSLDVTSFPRARHINEVVENIKTLIREEHDFKTVVVDSVDWLIPLIESNVEETHDEKTLAYGKGQLMVAEEFREILQGIDTMRRKRDMNVVLLAHANVVRFDDPRSEGYDRYTPKLPKHCNALLQEWVDVLAFAAFKVIIKKSDAGGFNKEKTRGITTGERLLHFVENPAFLAKNRYTLPDEVEMTYDNVKKLIPVKN